MLKLFVTLYAQIALIENKSVFYAEEFVLHFGFEFWHQCFIISWHWQYDQVARLKDESNCSIFIDFLADFMGTFLTG